MTVIFISMTKLSVFKLDFCCNKYTTIIRCHMVKQNKCHYKKVQPFLILIGHTTKAGS